MIKRACVMVALLLTACGGSPGQVAPIPEAEQGFRNFMQAAADSNYVRMAENWGTARGSASETGNPADYQQRMIIMQAYLLGIQSRVMANEAVPGAGNQRMLTVELTRGDCIATIPFLMARTGSGRWVVYQFDLEKIGPPTRSCSQPAAPPPGQ